MDGRRHADSNKDSEQLISKKKMVLDNWLLFFTVWKKQKLNSKAEIRTWGKELQYLGLKGLRFADEELGKRGIEAATDVEVDGVVNCQPSVLSSHLYAWCIQVLTDFHNSKTIQFRRLYYVRWPPRRLSDLTLYLTAQGSRRAACPPAPFQFHSLTPRRPSRRRLPRGRQT